MYTREEWEKKLNDVKIQKSEMNRIVMNYLVTEGYVEAAEKFQMETGTERIQKLLHVMCMYTSITCFIFFVFMLYIFM